MQIKSNPIQSNLVREMFMDCEWKSKFFYVLFCVFGIIYVYLRFPHEKGWLIVRKVVSFAFFMKFGVSKESRGNLKRFQSL